jgi:hypothetical protein
MQEASCPLIFANTWQFLEIQKFAQFSEEILEYGVCLRAGSGAEVAFVGRRATRQHLRLSCEIIILCRRAA